MKFTQRSRVIIVAAVTLVAAIVYVKIPIQQGLDLKGGVTITLQAKDTAQRAVDADAMAGVMTVLRSRIDQMGLTEPIIQQKGQRQIAVEIPGISDTTQARNLIGQTALLEFVTAEWAPDNIQTLSAEQQRTLLEGSNGRLAVVTEKDSQGKVTTERPIILKDTVMTGSDLKSASAGTDQYGNPVVNIEFTADGSKAFYTVTASSVGHPLAILLDGQIISAPNIREPISGGRAQISGGFSTTEMKDLIIKLKAGALPVPIEIVSEQFVGPTLGKDSIEDTKRAGLLGFVAVAAFMVVLYRLPGLLASLALALYILLTLAVLKLFHATLTLPGIAGIILTIGIAVDANVIIFERIKDEIRNGLTPAAAITAGFSRALVTILDSNVTTLLASGVLILFGTGSIKGFAITLSIGIFVSMFTAVFVTRMLVDFLAPRFPGKLFHVRSTQ